MHKQREEASVISDQDNIQKYQVKTIDGLLLPESTTKALSLLVLLISVYVSLSKNSFWIVSLWHFSFKRVQRYYLFSKQQNNSREKTYYFENNSI